MPEGDALHRVARELQSLVGERLEVEAIHPRAIATGVAPRIDGLRLDSVEAVGKNLLLRFDGGTVLRSHLRMTGGWRVDPRGAPLVGRPWLVLRGVSSQAVLRNGAVLELHARGVRGLGPDVLAEHPDTAGMVARLRQQNPSRAVGDALLDQRLVAGIGNIWKAEALWQARLSPWLPLGAASDDELDATIAAATRLMRASLDGRRGRLQVYRRAGRPCPRCGQAIRARGQGDGNRTAYWCPGCQRGEEPAGA